MVRLQDAKANDDERVEHARADSHAELSSVSNCLPPLMHDAYVKCHLQSFLPSLPTSHFHVLRWRYQVAQNCSLVIS